MFHTGEISRPFWTPAAGLRQGTEAELVQLAPKCPVALGILLRVSATGRSQETNAEATANFAPVFQELWSPTAYSLEQVSSALMPPSQGAVLQGAGPGIFLQTPALFPQLP